MTPTRHPAAALFAVVALSLQACAPLVVAGAGTAAVAANDRRTLGAFVDDETIELKIRAAVRSDDALTQGAHINATSVNGIVLLSGETITEALRDSALVKAREVAGIRRIVNELRVAPPASLASRSYDTWLTTKVKTKLINTEGLDATHVKVVSENKAVYLMGLVRRREADLATAAAREVGGVARVVKLFEYLD